MQQVKVRSIETFHSPTHGKLTLPKIIQKITDFAHAEPDYRYRIIIGTDSQTRGRKRTEFVTALIVHRIGGGGIYFWKRWTKTHPSTDKNKGKTSEGRTTLTFARSENARSSISEDGPFERSEKASERSKRFFGSPGILRTRIYEEALASLEFANEFLYLLKERPELLQFDLEIHVDIGERGKTREIISEVVAMIQGNGYQVKTKPDAYGASKVADRHV